MQPTLCLDQKKPGATCLQSPNEDFPDRCSTSEEYDQTLEDEDVKRAQEAKKAAQMAAAALFVQNLVFATVPLLTIRLPELGSSSSKKHRRKQQPLRNPL
jgi:hypothetical protein